MTLRTILIDDETGLTADNRYRTVYISGRNEPWLECDVPPEHLFLSGEPVAYIRVSKTGHVMACAKSNKFFELTNGTMLHVHPPITERNFCERCGKRLGDQDSVHTCTPPRGE